MAGGVAQAAGPVVALGECMVELSLDGAAAAVGYAGDTYNTAVYLSRLGVPCAYATALGDGDPFSGAILASLADEGIDASLVVRAPGRLPGLYAIECDAAGERSFYFWRSEAPARDYLDLVDRAALARRLAGARLIYLSAIALAVFGARGRAVLAAMLAEARAAGAEIAFDTNYRPRLWPGADVGRAAIAEFAALSDHISVGTADVAAFEGGDPVALAQGWAAGGCEVVLRHEDRRIEVFRGAEAERFAAEPGAAVVVDTTGAGDSFNAGYLAARLGGANVAEAVAAARQLAGAVVGRRGAIIPKAAMPA